MDDLIWKSEYLTLDFIVFKGFKIDIIKPTSNSGFLKRWVT